MSFRREWMLKLFISMLFLLAFMINYERHQITQLVKAKIKKEESILIIYINACITN